MKKISIILAALAACFAVSCTKEAPTTETQDPSAPAGMKKVTITAISEGATKTSYTDNGEGVGVFSWTEGDQISLLATDDQLYTFIAETSGATTNFTGYIPEGESVGRFAYFPASENHTYSTDWWSQYSIDEYKDMNGLASAEIPMYGLKGENDSYTFTHLTGAVQFTFTNIPDGLDEVEISIKNEQCKFSGLWSISTAAWDWSAAYTTNDSELTFTRLVPVKNNSAQLYLPYNGGIWKNSTLNIKALDDSGNEMVLLKDKVVKGNGTAIERAQIVPYAPLALPDYVPSVDWTKVDWTGENVLSYVLPDGVSSSRQVLREMQYFADEHYLYLRLSASIAKLTETSTEKLTFAFFDKTNGAGAGLWGWWAEAKGDIQYVAEGIAPITGTDLDVSISTGVNKQEDEDMVIWTFAIPRSTHEVFQNSAVYLGIMSQKGSDATGAIPDKYASMLEVTLP